MLDKTLFEFADVECVGDGPRYVRAKEDRSWEATLTYLQETNLRIDNLVFSPNNNQLRFQLLPCTANQQMTEVFNVKNPPVKFLRKLWETNVPEVQTALTKFMVQGYKDKYDGLNEEDKTWVTAAVLGGKDE